MDAYVERHLFTGRYAWVGGSPERYENAEGWTDYRIGAHIVFAHRTTDYTAENFRDALHAHDYCEVLFYVSGDVQYISGDRTEDPAQGSVIVIPPHTVHTTRLLNSSHYERYVFYVSPEAFAAFGDGALSVLTRQGSDAFAGVLCGERLENARTHLCTLKSRLEAGGESATLAAYAPMIELFLLAASAVRERGYGSGARAEENYLPVPVREIRRYIEDHYASIASVEEVAAHFYYSREYVTRLFRRYYNLSPGDYLEQCRIRAARERIASGERIADVCFGVGYRSASAFSSAFRRVTGKPPSAFRQKARNIHK